VVATIKDVAEYAGVGIGTVSRVLNGAASVSDGTRRKVVAAIRALEYRPSPAARALSRRRASTIAVTAPFLTRPSVVERVRGVVDALSGSEYDLWLAAVETPEQRLRRLAEVGQRDRADGALLISLAPTAQEEADLASLETPVVVVDSKVSLLASVITDDVAGGRMAAEYLLELGHRQIAYIGDEFDERFHFTSSADRLTGLRVALADADIEYDERMFAHGPHDRATATLLTQSLLAVRNPPTAIFASSDTQAIGVLEAARAAGIRVPDELSVIGFDDIETAELFGLTTVRQPLFESGRVAAELLLDSLGSQRPLDAAATRLPLTLVPRRTTGPPRRTTTQRRSVSGTRPRASAS
jgi:DNA-binding LacI/PurR family transcriptional regulator